MKFRLFLVVFAVFTALVSVAQTPAEDFDQVLHKYSALENFQIQVHYYIYASHEAYKPVEEAYGEFQKSGKKLRMQQYGTELIQDEAHTLIKDDSSKTIVFHPTSANSETSFDVQKTLSYYSKIEAIRARKAGQKAVVLYFKPKSGFAYEKAEAYFNSKTNLLEEVTLYYSEQHNVSQDPKKPIFNQPRIRMVYTEFDTKPNFTDNTFSLSKYINFGAGGKHSVKAPYQSFEFYDQTSQHDTEK